MEMSSGRDCAGVEAELVLAHHGPAQVEGEGRDVVDVDLGAESADPVATELDAGAWAAHRAAFAAARADETALTQLSDQGRNRRAGQPQLRGERGARAGTVVAEPTQDPAQVGPPQHQLVGGGQLAGRLDLPHRRPPPRDTVSVVTTLSGRCTK